MRHSLAALLATTALGVVAAHGVDATWVGGSSDWTDPANWSSNPSVPDGTATFTNTGSTAVDNNNGVVSVGTVAFASISQAYSITIGNPFIINGTGIVNNDTVNTQNFQVTSGNNLVFQNSSTASGGAGALTITNDAGGNVNFIQDSTAGTASLVNNSFVTFEDSSSAGSAQITNNLNGQIDFFTSASAGTATINNAAGASLNFYNTTTAATASIINDGTVNFDGSATAGSATITTNSGGTTNFAGTSTGGSARLITNAGGTVDISGLTSGGMTAGSIEGAGNYVLGANTLTTGSLNTSTQVDGVISGAGGGLTKVGTGTLTLTGTNTYSSGADDRARCLRRGRSRLRRPDSRLALVGRARTEPGHRADRRTGTASSPIARPWCRPPTCSLRGRLSLRNAAAGRVRLEAALQLGLAFACGGRPHRGIGGRIVVRREARDTARLSRLLAQMPHKGCTTERRPSNGRAGSDKVQSNTSFMQRIFHNLSAKVRLRTALATTAERADRPASSLVAWRLSAGYDNEMINRAVSARPREMDAISSAESRVLAGCAESRPRCRSQPCRGLPPVAPTTLRQSAHWPVRAWRPAARTSWSEKSRPERNRTQSHHRRSGAQQSRAGLRRRRRPH
nr:hypothetical protein [Bradyrhizobium sp. DOA9]